MESNTSLMIKSILFANFLRVKQNNNNLAGLTRCVRATNENLLLLLHPLFIIPTQLGTIPATTKENPENENTSETNSVSNLTFLFNTITIQ
ncbi:hypothetical protein R3W88_029375 [Solanum pinnatisectum]|uniref:Uncharacterized protein n=1 Tax=Solanum pinnatisectum TaxID=50273 RepID=A0AAV9K6V7_9SOLN|nr:hypothetical protein R3W88_029375 [Solanum pinnatisectum]